MLEDRGVMSYLDTMLYSEKEGVEKPSSEIFHRACERLGLKPEETVHIGDELDWCVVRDYQNNSTYPERGQMT